jgi:hypothetical protein
MDPISINRAIDIDCRRETHAVKNTIRAVDDLGLQFTIRTVDILSDGQQVELTEVNDRCGMATFASAGGCVGGASPNTVRSYSGSSTNLFGFGCFVSM